MTKEEAWEICWGDMSDGYEGMYSPRLHQFKSNAQAAFSAGWDAAVQSFTPHALPGVGSTSDTVPYKEVIDVFNEVFSERTKKITVTASYRKLIHARWMEGMRVEDFKTVCRIKKSQWDHKPDMRSFLRPETLFSNKMMTYRNEEEEGARCTVAEGQ